MELFRAKIDNNYRTKVKTELRKSKSNVEPKSIFVREITDDIYTEFMEHSGPKVRLCQNSIQTL